MVCCFRVLLKVGGCFGEMMGLVFMLLHGWLAIILISILKLFGSIEDMFNLFFPPV